MKEVGNPLLNKDKLMLLDHEIGLIKAIMQLLLLLQKQMIINFPVYDWTFRNGHGILKSKTRYWKQREISYGLNFQIE